MAKVPLTFKIYRGSALERTETLTQDIVKIGKLQTSHLRLDDESVSRMHAVVEVSPSGDVHIIDLGSQRGTLVKGQKVSKSPIADGDEIMLGDTRIVIEIGQAQAVAAATDERTVVSGVPAQIAQDQTRISAPPQGMPAPIASAAPQPSVVPPSGSMMAPPMSLPGAAPSIATGGYDAAAAETDDPAGARAVEVMAMFGDSVVATHHLTEHHGGSPTPATWARLGIGGVLLLGSLIAALVGQVGIGAIGLLVGIGIFVPGLLRAQEQKQPADFLVGDDPNAVFHAPSDNLPSRAFPLVRSTGNDFNLVVAPGMVGEINTNGQAHNLADFVSSGRMIPSSVAAGSHEWSIAADARARISIGNNTFLVNSVTKARAIPPLGFAGRDWTGDMYNAMSTAAHGLLLLLVLAIPPDPKSLSLDLFGADQQLIKFLVKPPEEKQEDMPAWLKKGPHDPGGKGQKHKGEEGKMGSKKSKKKQGLYGLKGPKDNPDPHLAKRLAEEAAQNAGVLGILGQQQGSHLASIFGRDTALGTDAENALGGLIGNTIGEAYGLGGLGLVGTGRGGGGTGEGTIGLGTLGTIGKGGGGGSGAGYGRGAGRLGGRRAKAPDVVPGRASVRGALDKEIIRRIVRRHINEVKFCYEKELVANPDLEGRVMVQFTISGAGSVVASVVQSSTMGNPRVEQCVAGAVKRWQFPKPMGGGIVIVSYPFVLRAN